MERDIVTEAIEAIDDFIRQSGMKESRLGLLSCANPRAIERIRNGRASVETLRAVLAYIAAAKKKGGR